MLSAVKRAYFNALARCELYVELTREDPGYIEGQCMVGRLRLALYGTRDAAQLWQERLAQHVVEIGFVRGISLPPVCTSIDLEVSGLLYTVMTTRPPVR